MQIERPGADGPVRRDAADARRRTAPSRASRRSPTTACWPGGWSSAACGSCSSITPTGTITATTTRTSASRSTTICQRGRSAGRGPGQGPEAARPAGRDAGDLGRRVRPHADGRAARPRSAATTTSTPTRCGWPAAASSRARRIGQTDEIGYYAVEDRVHVHDLQATILHLLGLDHKADLPLPGPRLPPDRRAGEVVQPILA